MSTCPCCGKDVWGLDREITLAMPDDLFDLSSEARRSRVRMWGKSFMALDGARHFVRVLLPVPLSVGHEYRFGVWLEVADSDFHGLLDVWDEPAYLETSLEGVLANAVPPWGPRIVGAPCHASARGYDDALFIDRSSDPSLGQVLSQPWEVHECEALIAEVWGQSGSPPAGDSRRPVLPSQPGDPAELRGVRRHQRGAAPERLPRD